MDISDRIQILRGEKTREQFIEGTSTSAQTLYKYEKRTGKPTLEFVEQICKKFNINYAWLISGEGPMHPEGNPQPAKNAPEQPVNTLETAGCARCAELKAELEVERRERRELAQENRQLWKENGDLKAICAELKERQKHCCPDPLLRTPPPLAPSNKERAQV